MRSAMRSRWWRWASRCWNCTWACREGLDHWTERLIGLTLIVLGIGVVAGILRKDAHGHRHSRIESRLAIAINGVLWMAWRVRRIWNRRRRSRSGFSGCTTASRSS